MLYICFELDRHTGNETGEHCLQFGDENGPFYHPFRGHFDAMPYKNHVENLKVINAISLGTAPSDSTHDTYRQES